MSQRALIAAVTGSVAAALIGGALALAPSSQAAPSGDTPPACLTDGTCARLIPTTTQYRPLTPPSTPQQAALSPE